MKRARPGRVDPLFLTACVVVLGLAFGGVLLMGLLGDSVNGLLFGIGLLVAAAAGGLGLAWYAAWRGSRDGYGLRAKSPEELKAELRRTPGPLVFGVVGGAFGAASSPFLCQPVLGRVLPGVQNGPVLWVAAVAAGLLVGGAAGAIVWLINRPR